jgi:hypothetical protein
MTTDKARKRAVRTRMQKTGERYAAARRHVVAAMADGAAGAADASDATEALPALPPRVAEPGMSDASIYAATGRGWDDWFRILDTGALPRGVTRTSPVSWSASTASTVGGRRP